MSTALGLTYGSVEQFDAMPGYVFMIQGTTRKATCPHIIAVSQQGEGFLESSTEASSGLHPHLTQGIRCERTPMLEQHMEQCMVIWLAQPDS